MKPVPDSPSSEPSPLLIFGAHPDDIEFGCGGVVAAETQSGRAVHFVVCSRGEAGTHGTPDERTLEAAEAARRLGATLEFTDLGGDAQMEFRLEHVLTLAGMIRRVRPRIVLAPTVVENQHPDHASLGRMVRDACRLARYGGVAGLRDAPAYAIRQLLFYAVTAEAEPSGQLPLWIDVSAPPVMQAWRAAMEAHASQLRTRNYVELQLTRARFNGVRCGLDHAIPIFLNDPLVFGSLGQLDAASRGARQF